MDLRAIVLACFAAPLQGCPSTFGCDPPREEFYLDLDLTNADLEQMWISADEVDSIGCYDLCEQAYQKVRGWEGTEVDSCTHDLDPPAIDTAEAAEDEVVGHVTCTGEGIEYYCMGRRPLGHRAKRPRGGTALGRALAGFAQLEGASVVAFEELAGALEGFGAPVALVSRCRAAADDERHHARWMGALAHQLGARVPAPSARRVRPTLAAVAAHNAVEGCVHESWAAVEAAWQASTAPDRLLRTVAARIARDEAAHGQLAWDLQAWLLSRLPPRSQGRILRAQRMALARLPAIAAATAAARPPELGLPGPVQARILAERFAALVFAQASQRGSRG